MLQGKKPLVELRGISKAFQGIKVLDNINLDIYRGEVHALLGENGAGKSTLVKILSGVYTRDSGTIKFNGEPVDFRTPREAQERGISIIHQELSLIPDLSIAANIFLGREYTGRCGFLHESRMQAEAYEAVCRVMDADFDLKQKVRDLNVAQRQLVEIARALLHNASLVIMDEPTSSLSEKEAERLFTIIERLREEGVAVLYISHRLGEIIRLADRITVLRDGRLVATLPADRVTETALVSLMVGREIKDYFDRAGRRPGEVVLRVEDLTDPPHYYGVTFDVRAGEIVGIAGLVGAGRTEVLRGIFGVKKPQSGRVYLYGQPCLFHSPREAIDHGLGFVPEDRRTQGIILDQSVKFNIALPNFRLQASKGFVDHQWENNLAREYVQKMKVRTPSLNALTRYLSGGNQQKVVLAKWLAASSKILLLDEPTRGIDVNAKAEIYNLMNAYVQQGGSILMVSSELPEILGMSDRVVVMHEGRVRAVLTREEAGEEKIMRLACGA
ncbi:MAG: sugar ABC transporter ATP-binding protein [Moorellaceae bacterium]